MLLGFIILAIDLFFYVFPFALTIPMADTLTVPAQQTRVVSIVLNQGDNIAGYITVTGGKNDIDFVISDPDGSMILDAGIIEWRQDYSLNAKFSGAYTLYFDNTFSLDATKTIFYSYNL